MSIATELQQAALMLATDMQQRVHDFETEKLEIEMQLAQVQAHIDAAGSAHKRFSNYRPEIGPDYQCPSCWIKHERRATLRPVSSDSDADIMRCSECHEEVTIENP